MKYEFEKSDPFYNQCHYREIGSKDWFVVNRDTPKEILKNCPYDIYMCDNNKQVYLITSDLFEFEKLEIFKGK